MGRYAGKTDRERSQDRIAQAQRKHENKLKNVRGLYPRDEICALKFDPSKYGERIRYLRTVKGMTATELAPEIGTTSKTLSRMEDGTIKHLNMDFLYLLCAVFGTSPHYLLGIVSDPDVVPQMDKSGNMEHLGQPIKSTEKDAALLTNKLVELCEIPGIVNDGYQKDPDLCRALLHILEHRNPDIRLRLKDAIRGICAVCLTPEEWEQFKSVEGWLS